MDAGTSGLGPGHKQIHKGVHLVLVLNHGVAFNLIDCDVEAINKILARTHLSLNRAHVADNVSSLGSDNTLQDLTTLLDDMKSSTHKLTKIHGGFDVIVHG
jgi:hypothetical protein